MLRFNMPVVPVDETDTHANGCKFKIDCISMPLYFHNVFSEHEVDAMDFLINRKTFADGSKALFARPTSSTADRMFALSFEAPSQYHIAKLYQGITAHTFHKTDNSIKLIGQVNNALYPSPKFSVVFYDEISGNSQLYVVGVDADKGYCVRFKNEYIPHLRDAELVISVGNGAGRYYTPTVIPTHSTIFVNPLSHLLGDDNDKPYFKRVSDYFRKSIPDSSGITLIRENDLIDAVTKDNISSHCVFIGYSKATTAAARKVANDKRQLKLATWHNWKELPFDHEVVPAEEAQ